MTNNVEIERFVWAKQDHFCEDCGRAIGVWAWKHSKKCQGCNLKARMKKLREIESRVGA